MVEDRKVAWRAGDAVYIPTWAWHQHTCTSERPCRYVACENAPMLQNLGVALREEG
jgi:gentisate 1,2-dioxygenase